MASGDSLHSAAERSHPKPVRLRINHSFQDLHPCQAKAYKTSREEIVETMDLNQKSNVLVADAEPLARRGLVSLLNDCPRLNVCAEAERSSVARELCARLRPAVLVMDPAQEDGFALIKDLPRLSVNTRVVVLTALEDATSVQRAFQLGARGYLTRRDPVAAVLSAVLGALEGERQIGPRAQRILLGELARGGVHVEQDELARLTHRERDVFRRIGSGQATRFIAEDLHMSVKTVETHRLRIKEKLGLRSGSELLQRAVLFGAGMTNSANGSPS